MLQTATTSNCDPSRTPAPEPDTCFDCESEFERSDNLRLCTSCRSERVELEKIQACVNLARNAIAAGVPPRFFFDAAETVPTEQQHDLRERLSKVTDGNAASPWLFVTGPVGTGKTLEACRAVTRRLWREGRESARFVSATAFVTGYTSASLDSKTSFLNRYADVPFLVVDDLGSEKATQHSADTLFALIERRYTAMRPTVFTSNFTLGKIRTRLAGTDDGTQAGRIVDRIVQMAAEFKLTGDSFRTKAPAPAQWAAYRSLVARIEATLRSGGSTHFMPYEKNDDDRGDRSVILDWHRELAQFVEKSGEAR